MRGVSQLLLFSFLCALLVSCSGRTVSAGKLAYDTQDLNQATKMSAETKKPIMIVFGADW